MEIDIQICSPGWGFGQVRFIPFFTHLSKDLQLAEQSQIPCGESRFCFVFKELDKKKGCSYAGVYISVIHLNKQT